MKPEPRWNDRRKAKLLGPMDDSFSESPQPAAQPHQKVNPTQIWTPIDIWRTRTGAVFHTTSLPCPVRATSRSRASRNGGVTVARRLGPPWPGGPRPDLISPDRE